MKRPALEKSAAIIQQSNGDFLWHDNIPVGMALVTETNRFLRVNRALCQFLGYSRKELLRKTVQDITHPDDLTATVKKIRQLQSGGLPYSRFEKRYIHKNGKVVWGEVNSTLIDDGSPNPKCRFTQVVDITKRKNFEEALAKLNEDLERKIIDRTAQLRHLTDELIRAEHRERRRIADILHENLQQQLCGMKFRACQLKAECAEPATINLADKLIIELDQAINLTRTLSSNLYPQVLSLRKIKGFIEWLADDTMKTLGLAVNTRVDARLKLASHELRIFVFDAIRELLLNVSKHSKVHTANVRVCLMANKLFRIQVKDAGVGYVPKHNHGANRHIGLFRIQERAQSLGGHFEVVSNPGKGTCATLILPYGKHEP